MKFSSRLTSCAALLSVALLGAGSAAATDLIYTPVNPMFGGNPNNAPGLLAIAQAQNGYKAPTNSPLDNFNNSLQQAILSKLLSQSLVTLFGKSSSLVPGIYETSAYTIEIKSDPNNPQNLTITTTDKKTGAVVSFTVTSSALDLIAPGP